MLDKSPIRVAAVLAVLVFASSGAAFAHFASTPEIVQSKATNIQPKVESASTTVTNETVPTTETSTQSGPCTKTVTESSDTDEPGVTNVNKTEIHCHDESSGGSTMVNISNESSQSATSGDSDGQSGSVSNSDTTDIQVN
jgi:hypothetical protein